jgi:hypothetical protein
MVLFRQLRDNALCFFVQNFDRIRIRLKTNQPNQEKAPVTGAFIFFNASLPESTC